MDVRSMEDNVVSKNCNEILKYLIPEQNTKLSNLKGFDLKELLILINKYYLILRDSVGLKDNVTFGLELEFEYLSSLVNNYTINRELKKEFSNNTWKTSFEPTVGNGDEISSPIMKDDFNNWKALDKVCQIVSKYARINKYCSGHIHVGAQILGDKKDTWLNFMKLWSAYENIIFRFCHGEYLTARPRLTYYAKPRAKDFYEKYIDFSNSLRLLEELLDVLAVNSYHAVNFENVINLNNYKEYNTIEFRHPNGTLEPVIWQNNVNLLVNLLEYAKSNDYDDDKVSKRLIYNLNNVTDNNLYSEINLEQALELSDMIFNTNLDKIYFLRQYLKFFEIGTEYFQKANTFVLKK